MTDLWDAKIYGRFLALRTRPAQDLLAAIPSSYQPILAAGKVFATIKQNLSV